jgi:hypothetical protein
MTDALGMTAALQGTPPGQASALVKIALAIRGYSIRIDFIVVSTER